MTLKRMSSFVMRHARLAQALTVLPFTLMVVATALAVDIISSEIQIHPPLHGELKR